MIGWGRGRGERETSNQSASIYVLMGTGCVLRFGVMCRGRLWNERVVPFGRAAGKRGHRLAVSQDLRQSCGIAHMHQRRQGWKEARFLGEMGLAQTLTPALSQALESPVSRANVPLLWLLHKLSGLSLSVKFVSSVIWHGECLSLFLWELKGFYCNHSFFKKRIMCLVCPSL